MQAIPTPKIVLKKFGWDWYQSYSCFNMWNTTTDDGPRLYYKLIFQASGSGELKIDFRDIDEALLVKPPNLAKETIEAFMGVIIVFKGYCFSKLIH